MHSLDNIEEILKFDKGQVLSSIEKLPLQIRQAWNDVQNLVVPKECPLAKNVVISGMGGSALGGRIVESLVADRARSPIEIVTEYNLPNYVNKDTLVIVSSYSGNTEETLAAAKEALNRGACIFGITTGGRLADFLTENGINGYYFEPKENPSNQPRMGLGYSIASILAVLAKCEFLNLLSTEVEEAIEVSKEFISEFGLAIEENQNIAKKFSRKLKAKIPILVASEHLKGSIHAFKNQLNENSKTFSCLFDLPELNHHLLEGLRNPAEAKIFLHFVFFYSTLYTKDVVKRYPLTSEVVAKNEVAYDVYTLRSRKKLDQIFETLIFGSYVNFYLAVLYGIDPVPIPWVDYFKNKLK